MLGPPTSELMAGAHAVIVAGGLLLLGYLVADLAIGRRRVAEVVRWGLALPGACVFSLLLMILHMVSSGGFFDRPLLVRSFTVTVFVGLLAHRLLKRGERDRQDLAIAGALVILAVVVWGSPVARMIPLTATADTQLHNGWIDQMLRGETTPGAVLTGDIPNYYPWLFHALGSLTTLFTPGGTPYHALAPLQLFHVAGFALTLFALGRSIGRSTAAGFGASLLGALSGGFGFVMLDGLDVVTDPRAGDGAAALTYGGDLLFSRSYNVAFHGLAPPFPRDLAFALLAGTILLLALAMREGGRWQFVASGVTLGMLGLTGGETFIVGAGVALVASLVSPSKVRTVMTIFVPALALYSLWAVPMIVNYARLDGFVSITHIIPVALPASAILISWGLATPFALVASAKNLRNISDPGVKLVAIFTAVSGAVLLISALIPRVLGDAFDTLGRAHRYWPIFFMAVAVLASLGVRDLLAWVTERGRVLGRAMVALLTALACASPAVASIALPSNIGRYPEIREAMMDEPDNLLAELRAVAGQGCVVAAPQSIAREVFSFTGFRMVLWTGAWFGENRARIRWGGIYDRIGSQEQRIRDNEILTRGIGSSESWREIARNYGVNVVIAEEEAASNPALAPLTKRMVTLNDEPFVMMLIESCQP